MALMDEREQDTVYEEDESFYQVRALNKNKLSRPPVFLLSTKILRPPPLLFGNY
jgi:hypothetical protein